jgi:signal transduction histidine kinase
MPPVLGDPALLRQVVANLVGNAVKFTRHRTPARIEIGTHPAPTPDRLAFFVKDNGEGFNPQYQDKLFRVFQRLHSTRDFEGTGIGLANVKRIITRHGGTVWAEGQPGQGATFHFTLRPAPKK